MTMTLGLAIAAVLVGGGILAYRLKTNVAPEASDEVVRVTRKNRAKQEHETAQS